MNVNELNSASVDDLEKIEGIGRKRAEEIVKFREEHGEFKNMEELKKIPGFSSEMMDNIRSGGRGGDKGDNR